MKVNRTKGRLRERQYISYCLYLLIAVIFPNSLIAEERPKLLVLGSAHFSSPGLDEVNFDIEDILSEQRQVEMVELVERLAKFKPTHIAIEAPSKYQDAVDDRYLNYREGNYELDRNEGDQIGLRLASMLGHERVYAVDWNDDPPGDVEADYNWHSYGQANGHEADVAAITNPESARKFMPELKGQSIITWLKQLNHPETLQASHHQYFDIAMIGDEENLIGANWVGTWYARNLKIFSRLVKLVENAEESKEARVLIIYGQGHAYLLQQFARESEAFELISVDSVLDE